jgi:hypothetical protein
MIWFSPRRSTPITAIPVARAEVAMPPSSTPAASNALRARRPKSSSPRCPTMRTLAPAFAAAVA